MTRGTDAGTQLRIAQNSSRNSTWRSCPGLRRSMQAYATATHLTLICYPMARDHQNSKANCISSHSHSVFFVGVRIQVSSNVVESAN